MLSIIFGFSSALLWGAADFFGGLASRKAQAYHAVLLGGSVGLVFVLLAGCISGEAPIAWVDWLYCTIGGSLGTAALLLFFEAMRRGQMSIAAPVSALMAAVLPVVTGMFLAGFPGWLTLLGFLLALASIWFISQADGTPRGMRLRLADLALPLLAGIGFGIYLIFIHRGSQNGLFWPMVSSRLAGVVTMLIYTLSTRRSLLPPASAWPSIILNGLLDVSGNAFYILAGHYGRMDVAAVLASLYPGSTVLLANLFLHERINRRQVFGILAALVAIVLLTV